MNTVLQEALTGAPVTVYLAGLNRVLAFPGAAVILYKKETALLDRARAQGRPRLTLAEKRELRAERRTLLDQAEALRPSRGESWTDDNFNRFQELLDEAMGPKIALDEDAGTGDSLYDKLNWRKISPQEDPERFLLALWVGLHKFQPALSRPGPADREYVPTITRDQLSEVVDLGNGDELILAISKALAAHILAPEAATEEPDPNRQPPASPAVALVQAKPELVPQPPSGLPERRHPAPSETSTT